MAALIDNAAAQPDMFTLANGLRVVVQTDRREKTVSVSVIYNVGSTAEPEGRTGFAHLFEHLMFNGSENAPGAYIVPLQKLGAAVNGATDVDRTRYYEVVPTAGLEQALFLESDRMGWLLGAITRTSLDEQRAVVQNEKRQGENRPLAMVRQRISTALYPAGHPYAHSIIGSMADLDAASLDDVRAWFRAHYAPNNAVLTLAGDIDVATARALVKKYFGAIPAGPTQTPLPAPVPTLPQRIDDRMTDRVSAPTLYRAWALPGVTHRDAAALKVMGATLGGMRSSYLKQALVEREKLFTSLSCSVQQAGRAGTITIEGVVRDGVDPVVAGRRLDAAIAAFVEGRTTADQIERYVTGIVANQLAVLDTVGGMANLVAEGIRLGEGPDFHRRELTALTVQTPDSVRAAAVRWLGRRPVYALTVMPGPAPAYAEPVPRTPAPGTVSTGPAVRGTRGPLPPVGTFADLVFPTVERTRLSNGIELAYIRGSDVPVTQVAMDFDAGDVADPLNRQGTQALMIALLDKGTATREATAITQDAERLGARTVIESDADRTSAQLWTPSANLKPALERMADMLRNPVFPPAELEQQRGQILARIADAANEPGGSVSDVLGRLIDSGSPYAERQGPGDATVVKGLTRADLIAFHHAWLRPEKARLFVVSNRPLAEIHALAERSFGDWRGIGPTGVKDGVMPPRPTQPRIVLIDTPGAPQSIIAAGRRSGLRGGDDMLAVETANVVLGNGFTSRLNTDLRERKGWSYGVESRLDTRVQDAPFILYAPVQQNRTGAAVAAIREDIAQFLTTRPITRSEFDDAVDSQARSVSTSYGGARGFMYAIRESARYDRPASHFATLISRYRALSLDTVRAALKEIADPAKLTWVVAGDAAKVRPQLDGLGLPVTVIPVAAK